MPQTETDPLEVSIVTGTVSVLVTADTVSFVLSPDHLDSDYARARWVAGYWPHSADQHDVIYLPDGRDVLIFLR